LEETATELDRQEPATETADRNSLQIVAYCCEHCAYAAADLAGNLRLRYPPEVKIVQLPCTGKLDTLMVLAALEDGVDGVMVAG
jgi:coenzyme F420-reducing hydrogenase delta subunit